MKLHVESFGADGCPTILMLHGAGAPPETLKNWAIELANDYRVLVPHRNGYGRTGVFDYDPEAELQALLKLMGDSATVLGHSFGAFRAFQLAGLAPSQVERVIGIGSIAGLPEEAREAVNGLAGALRAGADLAEAAAANWLTPGYLAAHPEIPDTIRGWLASSDREIVARENLEVLDGGQTLKAFAASGVPARLYVGEQDGATPPGLSHPIAELAADVKVTVVGDMGHLPMFEDFEGSVSWIREALKS